MNCLHNGFLVLHPRHKLQYFKNAGWEQDWIDTAKGIVRSVFDRSYAPRSSDRIEVDKPESAQARKVRPVTLCPGKRPLVPQQSRNIFDDLPSLNAPNPDNLGDELDRYLNTDQEHTADVLMWWYDHSAAFPRLSRMALDYLSIPGTHAFDRSPAHTNCNT